MCGTEQKFEEQYNFILWAPVTSGIHMCLLGEADTMLGWQIKMQVQNG